MAGNWQLGAALVAPARIPLLNVPIHDPHSALFGDAARSGVRYGLGRPQHFAMQSIEPVVSDDFAGFGHQALLLPGQAEPKATILAFALHQRDASDEAFGIGLQP